MQTLLKHITRWVMWTFLAFVIIYLLGSFCAMTFDLASWTNIWARFGMMAVAVIAGVIVTCCVDDTEKWEAMSTAEREKVKAARAEECRNRTDY